MRVPLWSLITGAGTVMSMMVVMTWSVAQQSNKVDQLIDASVKMEKRFEDKDRVFEASRLRQDSEVRRVDKLESRMDVVERTMK